MQTTMTKAGGEVIPPMIKWSISLSQSLSSKKTDTVVVTFPMPLLFWKVSASSCGRNEVHPKNLRKSSPIILSQTFMVP